jgi:uncharacterized OB-fold protein
MSNIKACRGQGRKSDNVWSFFKAIEKDGHTMQKCTDCGQSVSSKVEIDIDI